VPPCPLARVLVGVGNHACDGYASREVPLRQEAFAKCLMCGERIPLHTRWCPHCGRELLDRHVWYNKHASDIVGALLGDALALFWMVQIIQSTERNYRDGPLELSAEPALLTGVLLGLLVGFLAWDFVRDAMDDGLSTTVGRWQRRYFG